jgi:hypothetical protein
LQTACHLRVSKKKFSCLEEVSAFDLRPHTFLHFSSLLLQLSARSCYPMSFPVLAFLLFHYLLLDIDVWLRLFPQCSLGEELENIVSMATLLLQGQ